MVAIKDLKLVDYKQMGFNQAIDGKRFISLYNITGRNKSKEQLIKEVKNERIFTEKSKKYNDVLPRSYKTLKHLNKSIRKFQNYTKEINNGNYKIVGEMLTKNYRMNEKTANKYIDYIINKRVTKNKFAKIMLTLGNSEKRYISITDESKKKFFNLITNRQSYSSYVQGADISDALVFSVNENITSYKLIFIEPYKSMDKSGHFFKWFNSTNIDLTKYQIYKENEEHNNEHCIIHTLRLCGVSETLLKEIKLSINSDINFSKKNLHKISKIIDKKIILYTIKNLHTKKDINKAKQVKYTFGDKTLKESIEIVLYKQHYYIYEPVNYTKFSINNYDKLKDRKEWFNYTDLKHKSRPKYINSLDLIYYLFETGQFKKTINTIKQKQNVEDNNNNLYFLDNIENEQKQFELKDNIKITNYTTFYADLENIVRGVKYHSPILAGIVCESTKCDEESVKIFRRTPNDYKDYKIIEDMFDYASKFSKTKDNIIYFHNLKYDFCIIKSMYVTDIMEKEGSVYEIKIEYNNKNFYLRDSMKFISEGLNKFNKIFGLPKELNKKEGIAYDYYTINNLENEKVKVTKYEKYLYSDESKKNFRLNIEEIKDIVSYDGTYFNPLAYYEYYLKYDCLVLKEGFTKFRSNLMSITKGHEVHHYRTISSYIDSYAKKQGCYDGICMLKGNVRNFIQGAVRGGRVLVNEKYKGKSLKKKGGIADYDAISLYATSLYRICTEMGGFSTGKCKRITQNKDWKSKANYYVVQVHVKKVNKKQQMPFLCYLDKKTKTLQYTNDIEGQDVIIDKITYEDLKEFHGLKAKIKDGVYWDEGLNDKFKDVVKSLFEQRKEYKQLMKKYNEEDKEYKENNSMQQALKLMLNSLYGKTIMKKSFSKKHIISDSYFVNFYCNNYETIKDFFKLNKKEWCLNLYDFDNSYNFAHVGAKILSVSKRIINEIMNLANDNNIPIYYQDTDSLHLNYNDVSKLEKLYYEKYNKILTGCELGQLHVDFDFEGCREVKAIESIFIRPKYYCDYLEGVDIKTGLKKYKIHYRLKGATSQGLEDYVNKKYKNIESFDKRVLQMYRDRTKNIIPVFPNAPDKKKVQFKNCNYNICTLDESATIRTF